jgi:hypothetical protein
MATPIPFSVAAAQRTGVFETSSFTKPAGYTRIQWSLNIPNQAEYENTANGFSANILYDPTGGTNFVSWSQATWQGGAIAADPNRGTPADPPPVMAWDISAMPTGSRAKVHIVVTGIYTIGISNGSVT